MQLFVDFICARPGLVAIAIILALLLAIYFKGRKDKKLFSNFPVPKDGFEE